MASVTKKSKSSSNRAKTKNIAKKSKSRVAKSDPVDTKRHWNKMQVELLTKHLEKIAEGKTAKEAAESMDLKQPTYLARLRNAGVSIRKVKKQFEKGVTAQEIAEKALSGHKVAKSSPKLTKQALKSIISSLNANLKQFDMKVQVA